MLVLALQQGQLLWILSYELLTLDLGVPPYTNKPKKGNKDHIFLVFQTKILIKQRLVFYKFIFA